jgi:hypothetical protein
LLSLAFYCTDADAKKSIGFRNITKTPDARTFIKRPRSDSSLKHRTLHKLLSTQTVEYATTSFQERKRLLSYKNVGMPFVLTVCLSESNDSFQGQIAIGVVVIAVHCVPKTGLKVPTEELCAK